MPSVNIETTTVFELPEFQIGDMSSAQFKEYNVKLRNTINKIALILNMKETGLHTLEEYACGKTMFPDPALSHLTPQKPVERSVFRKTFLWTPVGGIPNGLSTINHNLNINPPIECTWSFMTIAGIATDTVNQTYIPIPYIDPVGNHISLGVTSTQIIINAVGAKPHNLMYFFLEYLKY